MEQTSKAFFLFFTVFILGFFCLGILAYEAVEPLRQQVEGNDGWNSNPLLRNRDFWTIFKNNNLAAIIDEISQGPDVDDPIHEDWMTLRKRHGLVIHQIQRANFSYSYGNNGTYRSNLYEKMHTKGKRGHYTSMYFLQAQGETDQAKSYISGFAIFSSYHYTSCKSATKWRGKEKGLYFIKNPDGSYTIYGSSTASSKGRAKSKGKMTLDITTSSISAMNATTFAAKTFSNSNYTLDFSGREEVLTGSLAMITKSATQRKDHTNISADIKGVFPRGKGVFHTSTNATITGSYLNSTMVSTTTGHTWFGKKVLSTENLKTFFNLNFLFGIY